MTGSVAILGLALCTAALSAVYSGLETGMYRLSRLRVRLGAEKGHWRPKILSEILPDGAGLLLSLLVANNLANYVTTSCVTYLLLGAVASAHAAELLAAMVTAPLLFVFAESTPKSVFLYRADVLMPFFAPMLLVTHRLLTWCGAVPLLKGLSYLFGYTIRSSVPSKTMIASAQRHQVRAILRDTQEEGLLSPIQTDIVDRIVNIPSLRLSAVMVPLNEVQSVSVGSGRTVLLNKLRRYPWTRLIVWQDAPTHIIGFVNVYDVLNEEVPFDDLSRFVMPLRQMDSRTAVIDAIDVMRRDDLEIVLVTRSRRGSHEVPVGIVTMKDLVEELLGELAEW
ncbi:MAG: CNNM domain-containing protein [Sedimentisphaerales bacterium]|mgnify:CR=1 FL=1|jgi:CBS domain containing-hemolysin-like protein|nr:CNNM domain-containing protein [Sedimentisphaerales bacterium]HNY79205.1 CNNM domain-containing protein [Sedimentisphaerales bacterium]HOC61493.1 CNNM domain-containing protein [Sedimentisphaerales bacterium]HOH65243.1 CNNM domain-containing protein [Sedimentisphaerales bacterium]HQA89373.1 CNNM domain-containing protein [Sedimentisphaerales bacterium]